MGSFKYIILAGARSAARAVSPISLPGKGFRLEAKSLLKIDFPPKARRMVVVKS
jgi:hypothetical protein